MTGGLARSVHVRLVRHAHNLGVDPNLVFTRYTLERFLYRLSSSGHRDGFILKGAMLMLVWLGEEVRPTRDADLLALESLDSEAHPGTGERLRRRSAPGRDHRYVRSSEVGGAGCPAHRPQRRVFRGQVETLELASLYPTLEGWFHPAGVPGGGPGTAGVSSAGADRRWTRRSVRRALGAGRAVEMRKR